MFRMQRHELLDLINAVSFAMFDTVLYLDTHPTDRVALDYYEKHNKIREQATKEYTTYFGPLTSDNVDITNRWTWVDSPWPWEVEE